MITIGDFRTQNPLVSSTQNTLSGYRQYKSVVWKVYQSASLSQKIIRVITVSLPPMRPSVEEQAIIESPLAFSTVSLSRNVKNNHSIPLFESVYTWPYGFILTDAQARLQHSIGPHMFMIHCS